MADVDKWIEITKECKYLPENDLKVRCLFYAIILDMNVKINNIVLFLSYCIYFLE